MMKKINSEVQNFLNKNLEKACIEMDLEEIKNCVKAGAKIDFLYYGYGTDLDDTSPLHLAIIHGKDDQKQIEVVKYILGFKLSSKDFALSLATVGGKFNLVKFLVEEFQYDIHHNNEEAFLYALLNKHPPIIDYFLACGIDFNAENSGKAIFYSAQSDLTKYLEKILALGVSIDIGLKYATTEWHMAFTVGNSLNRIDEYQEKIDLLNHYKKIIDEQKELKEVVGINKKHKIGSL